MGDSMLLAATAIAAVMLTTWLVSLVLSDVSIVDIVWGAGFVVVAWVSWVAAGQPGGPPLVALGLVTVWGLRLAGYLAWRNIGEPEDRRYAKMRERYGDRFPIVSLAIVFGLQGVIMWTVSLPTQAAPRSDAETFLPFAVVGVALWLIGFYFEAVGDAQLARFKSDPANQGQVLDTGVWRYTRHPNYFGDAAMWWGVWLVAVSRPSLSTVVAVVGPVVMTVFLLRVSGVALLERSIGKRRPGYEDYVRRTSAFIPRPPRD